jgi:hypothetical protein
VIVRPWRLPEAVWAIVGAAILVLAGLLPAAEALRGVAKGTDVYLFLIGMMLLAELARQERLFDWLAAWAARLAQPQHVVPVGRDQAFVRAPGDERRERQPVRGRPECVKLAVAEVGDAPSPSAPAMRWWAPSRKQHQACG